MSNQIEKTWLTNMTDGQYEYDVFISHASEDKDGFVRELASNLLDNGIRVWYDEFTLQIGASLSNEIDRGLLSSRYGVLVISEHFIKKAWTKYEFRGLQTIQINSQVEKILPIRHNVTHDQVVKYSPALADMIALDSSEGIDLITLKLIRVIRPDIFKALVALKRFRNLRNIDELDTAIAEGRVSIRKLSEFKKGPRHRQSLSDGQMRRVRILSLLLSDVANQSLASTYDSFLRDLTAEDEIQHWEWIALIFALYKQKSNAEKDELDKLFKELIFLNYKKITTRINREQMLKLMSHWQRAGLNSELLLEIIETTNQHPILDD